MPRALALIPQTVPITDKSGAITEFFRYRWQQLIDGFARTPVIGSISSGTTPLTAALGTTRVYLVLTAGLYRVSFVMRKTIADGVASSLTATITWVRGGITCTEVGAALTTDTNAAQQNGSVLVNADAATDLSLAIAYASNTPNKMTYEYDAIAELVVTT